LFVQGKLTEGEGSVKVDLLIRVAQFVKKVNNILKSEKKLN